MAADPLSSWWYGKPPQVINPQTTGNESSWWYGKPSTVQVPSATNITITPGVLSVTSAVQSPLSFSITQGPSVGSNNSSIGTGTWLNPGNITASDGSYATAPISATSDYLVGTGFNFNIPADATITGIIVQWQKTYSGLPTSSIVDNAVRLVKAGNIETTDRSNGTPWSNSDVFTSYGNSTDLWGDTWSPSDINNVNFGTAISVSNITGDIPQVDYVNITVYYNIPNNSQDIFVSLLSVSSSVQLPTVLTTSNVNLVASVLNIASVTQAPTISGVALVITNVLNITSAVYSAVVSGSALILPSVRTIISGTLAPVIIGNASVVLSIVSLTSAANAPNVGGTVLITPSVLNISSSANIVTVSGNSLVIPSVLNITSAVYAVTTIGTALITPSTLSIVSVAQIATESSGVNVTITPSVLSITTGAKSVSVSVTATDALNGWWYFKPSIVIDPNYKTGGLGNWWYGYPSVVVQGTQIIEIIVNVVPVNISSGTYTPSFPFVTIFPNTLNVSVSTQLPSIVIPTTATPAVTTIGSATHAPTVTTTSAILTLGTLGISSGTYITYANTGVNLLVGTGVGYLSPIGTTFEADTTVQASTLNITSATYAPTLFLGSITVFPPVVGITSSAKTATFISGNVTINATTLSISSSVKVVIGIGLFPTTGILDSFNRGNSATLGSNWSGPAVGDPINLGIVSNAATSSSNNYAADYWNQANFSSSNFEIYLTLSALPVSGDVLDIWALDSPTSGTFNGYILDVQPNISQISLSVAVGGSGSTVLTITQSFNAGDSFGMKKFGNTITVWYQPSAGAWTYIGYYVDSNNFGNLYLGFESSDNTLRAINFGGGSPVAVSIASSLNIATGVFSPVVNDSVFINAPTLSISSSTQIPTVNVDHTVAVSSVSISSAIAPVTPAIIITPNALNISTGVYSEVISGFALVSVSSLTIASALLSPTVLAGGSVTINVSSLSISSSIQAVSIIGIANVNTSVVNISSSANTVSVIINTIALVSTINIVSATYLPGITGTANIAPSVLNIVSSAKVVIPSGSNIVSVSVLNITSNLFAPTIKKDFTVFVGSVNITSVAQHAIGGFASAIVNVVSLSITSALYAPTFFLGYIRYPVKIEDYLICDYVDGSMLIQAYITDSIIIEDYVNGEIRIRG